MSKLRPLTQETSKVDQTFWSHWSQGKDTARIPKLEEQLNCARPGWSGTLLPLELLLMEERKESDYPEGAPCPVRDGHADDDWTSG